MPFMSAATWVHAMTEHGQSALDSLLSGYSEALDPDDVAKLLGVSRPTVYAWLRDGVIPGYKIGTTWRILRDELKDTIERGANTRGKGGESCEQ